LVVLFHMVVAALLIYVVSEPYDPYPEDHKMGIEPDPYANLYPIGIVIILVETGFGLWRGRRWGWWSTLAVNLLAGAFLAAVTVDMAAYAIRTGYSSHMTGSFEIKFIYLPLLIHACVVWYLFRRTTRQRFAVRLPRIPLRRGRQLGAET
jgi:hypothetical protein